MRHLGRDDYILTLTGEISWEEHLRRSQEHLLDLCPTCRGEWDGDPHPLEVIAPADDGVIELATVDARLEVSLEQLAEERQLLSQMREARRLAKDDLWKLEQRPAADWPGMVERSRTRFRSRALAELLVEESVARARISPETAAALADLVPAVLATGTDHRGMPWGRILAARALAHQANALRILGDLPGADRLLQQIGDGTPPTNAVSAEVASLKASLRLAQRRFPEALECLAQAARQYEAVGETSGVVQALIGEANVLQTLGRPKDALTVLRTAASQLESKHEPYLFACTVTGRVNSLCDLDRYDEAKALLEKNRALYEAGDAAVIANLSLLRARIDLGHKSFGEAVRGFTDARDLQLALGRDYDGALTSLYLADALLRDGQTTALRELASELVPIFEAVNVTREALAALRLLVEAIRAETASSALIADVRRTLQVEP